jgi:RNA polymerase sigma factor (sigma-70 family)
MATPQGCRLNLKKIVEEEVLVFLAQEGYQPAVEEVILRNYEKMKGQAGRLARRRQLPAAHVPDAEQNAVLALREAIFRYDTGQMRKPQGRSFCSFLRRHVHDRLSDDLKHFRREEKHYDRSESAAQVLTAAPDQVHPRGRRHSWVNSEPGDPAAAVEQQEARERLRHAVEQLREEFRPLWEGLVSGRRLGSLAQERQVSLATVKRWRNQLLGELKTKLGEETEG